LRRSCSPEICTPPYKKTSPGTKASPPAPDSRGKVSEYAQEGKKTPAAELTSHRKGRHLKGNWDINLSIATTKASRRDVPLRRRCPRNKRQGTLLANAHNNSGGGGSTMELRDALAKRR